MWPLPEHAHSPPLCHHTELGWGRGSALQMGCVRRSAGYEVESGAARAEGVVRLFEAGHAAPLLPGERPPERSAKARVSIDVFGLDVSTVRPRLAYHRRVVAGGKYVRRAASRRYLIHVGSRSGAAHSHGGTYSFA